MNKKLYLILVLLLPTITLAQFTEAYSNMTSDKELDFKNYEKIVLDATTFIFSKPINPKSKEFISATKIVGFWMNNDTGMNIPTFGNFYTSLTNVNQQQFLYSVAMINYELDQKINHTRILKCVKIDGQIYSNQDEVKEVQLEGAKILLEYAGNKNNNVPLNSDTKKYLKAFKKNKLEKMFFD